METLFIETFVVFIRQVLVSYWSNWEILIHDLSVDVFVTSESIHLYISDFISLYPVRYVCSSDRESH